MVIWKGQCRKAKLPKSGKLEKSKNNYNFLKLVPNVVKKNLNVVKFDVGLGKNYCKIAPSFIFFWKNILCFWDKFVKKNGQKVGDFNITFSKAKHIFEMTMLFPMFLCPIRFIKLAFKLKFKHKTCLILGHQYFVSVMDTACVSDGQMHIFLSSLYQTN